jgi:LRR receptor-like serine/threonine-protein kinase FLS2
MSSLRNIDFCQNLLTGPLYSHLEAKSSDTLSPLETMDLSVNRFKGRLRTNSWPLALAKLRHLDLSGNFLTGTVPVLEMSQMLPQLEFLWLGSNLLSGSLPPDQNDWTVWSHNLELLDLGSNLISGKIPPGLAAVPLKSLILADNDLEGPLPLEMLRMSSLWTLQLQDNYLSGSIPIGGNDDNDALTWSNLSNLGALLLRSNQLTGSINSNLYLGLQSNLRQYVQ